MMLGRVSSPRAGRGREVGVSIVLLAVAGTSVGGLLTALTLVTRLLGR